MKILTPQKAIAGLENYVINPNMDIKVTLGVILNEYPNSSTLYYLQNIKEKSKQYGVRVFTTFAASSVEALNAIHTYKNMQYMTGIILLSSFGKEVDQVLKDQIPRRLDCNCQSTLSVGYLITSKSELIYRDAPCGQAAAIKLLDYEDIDFKDKKVAILSNSLRSGAPLIEILSRRKSIITIYQSKEQIDDLSKYDIIISDLGVSHTISLDDDFSDKNPTVIFIDTDLCHKDIESTSIQGDLDIRTFENTDITIADTQCINELACVVMFAKLFYQASQTYLDRKKV
jgi:5,10-methylene-tetrahydrofolate dehydrogenase/methenyl tetrahydrofolate cyclohydrolase